LAIATGLLVAVIGVGAAAWLLVLRGTGTTPTTALDAPQFLDEAATSGLDHTYDGDSRFWVGGGLATFDCDDDGRPELYLAGGGGPAALYRNESVIGGALRFSELPDPTTDLLDVTGAYPLDIDGDGRIDLAVLRAGENILLRGLGDCRFERANERWGFDGGSGRTMAFSATWERSSGLPTIAIGDYIALDELGAPQPPCPDNQLFRATAAGDAFAEPVALAPGYCPLSMLFSDWSRSGRRDLRVANDRQYYTDGQEQLWRIAEGASPELFTDADGWVSMQIFGMGIASQDLTGDGYPEVYLTSQGDNKLQTLLAGAEQPTYRDIALRRGVNAPQPFTGGDSLPSTAWHPEFADVNNDGFVDLFLSKGNVSEQAGYATRDPSELLLGGPEGTFRQGADAAGIVGFERGRGASVADLNLDGLLDLVVVNLGEPAGLWRNVGSADETDPLAMGSWVAVRPQQPGANRDAIGSWIEVRIGETTLLHEITVGGGHASGALGWIHFGLGEAMEADVRVTWPDGEVGPWQKVEANGFAVIERGGEVVPWTPNTSAER
jgi:hypothetical protein